MNRMHSLTLILGMGDRENSDERPRDTLMLSRENSDARAPRESVSWSMGDHQRFRGQSPMRSAERLHNNAMHTVTAGFFFCQRKRYTNVMKTKPKRTINQTKTPNNGRLKRVLSVFKKPLSFSQ